jgi:hypothetical protein
MGWRVGSCFRRRRGRFVIFISDDDRSSSVVRGWAGGELGYDIFVCSQSMPSVLLSYLVLKSMQRIELNLSTLYASQ